MFKEFPDTELPGVSSICRKILLYGPVMSEFYERYFVKQNTGTVECLDTTPCSVFRFVQMALKRSDACG
jgi:hypothetical protein